MECVYIQLTQFLSEDLKGKLCCTSRVTLVCTGGYKWAISSWSGPALSLQFPHNMHYAHEIVWGMPWHCLNAGNAGKNQPHPLEVSIWGQSLALWTEEIQHYHCTVFVLLDTPRPQHYVQMVAIASGQARLSLQYLQSNWKWDATYWKRKGREGMGRQNGSNSNALHGCTLESFQVIPNPFKCLLK